ncbi:hypothetical protein QZH41_000263 [Actinostola sp. cb2023]|nr:hypothetical protein QZH41_000263 [Actinostola sp. cb2023]
MTSSTVIHQKDPNIEQLVEEYHDIFTGLGKHKFIQAKLIVDETVPPIAHKQRKIPYNLKNKASLEEKRLENLGVIEVIPDDVPTTWCSNPVVTPKPHNPEVIRYCCDMRVPNTAIQRPITEVPTIEDIKFKLEGACVFSVLDMNEGYHQLKLDESSRHLTTFYGTTKKFRYKRLNFGAISSQDIFDKAMDDTIDGLEGVLHIRDDFVVFGKTLAEHDISLRALLQRFRECGLTFNLKKCKFRLPEIELFGLMFSKDGIKPAPSKVDALKSMSPPSNVSEVRSLLGMAQYSAQFIPNFSAITAPLRQLTRKETAWKWSSSEQNAFELLQKALSSESVLGYYEIDLETKMQVDAGPNGLGLILLQNKPQGWQPVVCASRSLTDTEKRYSQTEREALAIRWACKKNGADYFSRHAVSTTTKDVKDTHAKARMKEYADKKRHTQPHDIQVGDSVLVRQEKRNKFTTPFEPVLYTVISVNRSMITAHRTTDEREITRNSSHYKKVNIQGQRPETPETRPKTQDMRPETQEQNIIGFDVSNSSSEIQIPDNQPSVEHQAVQEPQTQITSHPWNTKLFKNHRSQITSHPLNTKPLKNQERGKQGGEEKLDNQPG